MHKSFLCRAVCAMAALAGAWGATSAVQAGALCDLDALVVSQRFDLDPGRYQNPTLGDGKGYDGVRLEGQFVATRDDPEWRPLAKLYYTSEDGSTYALRYKLESGATDTLSVSIAKSVNGVLSADDFGISQPLYAPFRAEMLWNGQGDVTVSVYTGADGFDGKPVSRTFHAGRLKDVSILVSTAVVDIRSARFGHACSAK